MDDIKRGRKPPTGITLQMRQNGVRRAIERAEIIEQEHEKQERERQEREKRERRQRRAEHLYRVRIRRLERRIAPAPVPPIEPFQETVPESP